MTADGETFPLPDGRRIGFRAMGPEGGRPVLYFHGCPGSRLDGWGIPGAEAAMQERGVRVFALERPGFGLSDPRRARRVVDWVDDVRAFADRMGLDRFAVYGVSAGGRYALACAARLGARVFAVASVSGVGVASIPGYYDGMGPNERTVIRLTRLWPRLIGPVYGLVVRNARRNPDRFFHDFAKDCSPSDRALLARPDVREMLRATVLEAVRSGTSGAVEDYAAVVKRPWGFAPEDVQVPAFLIFGDAE
jgi:pimeloyl-ACP methyl ester carboxylesterase